MKHTLKALAVISVPVFIIGAIFKVTVLQAYIDAKKLGAAAKTERAPAVLSQVL